MSEYKNPDKMSVVELRRVARRAINVLRSSGYGGWDLQDAYAKLRAVLELEEEDPTPWCHVCGAKEKAQCDCGPIAEND